MLPSSLTAGRDPPVTGSPPMKRSSMSPLSRSTIREPNSVQGDHRLRRAGDEGSGQPRGIGNMPVSEEPGRGRKSSEECPPRPRIGLAPVSFDGEQHGRARDRRLGVRVTGSRALRGGGRRIHVPSNDRRDRSCDQQEQGGKDDQGSQATVLAGNRRAVSASWCSSDVRAATDRSDELFLGGVQVRVRLSPPLQRRIESRTSVELGRHST